MGNSKFEKNSQAVIGYQELVANCFSRETLKSAKIGKVKRGPYVARLSWRVEWLPFGEQIVWILFSPQSRRTIDKILDQTINFANFTDRRVLLIDDYDPKKLSIPLEVSMLSDGKFTCNAMTLTLEDGSTGHIGWFIGQGRKLDLDDEAVNGALHAIITNLFRSVKKLKDNPFIKAGTAKLLKMQDLITQQGGRVGCIQK